MSRQANYSLAGKVALITGAGRGLGAATAEVVVLRGARVALLDLDHESVERSAAALPEGRAIGIACDVTDLSSLRDAAERTVSTFGGIDVAVANAGVLGRGSTFRTLTPADVGQVMAVNVEGVVNTASVTIEEVIRNRGQIVVISSVFAYLNGAAALPYAMSKAAVAQFGRGLAVELAPHGASVLTAYFSLLETEMIHGGVDVDPDVSAVLARTPKPLLKRLHPTEAAEAIVNGLEARSRAVAIPRRWQPVAALQGILGPLVDTKLAGDTAMHAALTRLEQQRTQLNEGTN